MREGLSIFLTLLVLCLAAFSAAQELGLRAARFTVEKIVEKAEQESTEFDYLGENAQEGDGSVMRSSLFTRAISGDDAARAQLDVPDEDFEKLVKYHFTLRRLISAQAASAADKDYAGLFSRIALPREDKENLRALLQSKSEISVHLLNQLRNPTLTWKQRRMLLWKARMAGRSIEAEIADLLSEQDYNEYVNYLRTLRQRKQLAPFKDKLYAAGKEMSREQEEELIQTLYDNRLMKLIELEDPELFRELQKLPEERELSIDQINIRKMIVYHNRDILDAEEVLTPEQMTLFEQYSIEREEHAAAHADYAPTPEPERNDRAEVAIEPESMGLSEPIEATAVETDSNLWFDHIDGSGAEVIENEDGTLGMSAHVNSGWGAGITLWPGGTHEETGRRLPVDASGGSTFTARIKAPPGATLRFGLLESGANVIHAGEYVGERGADGEAFRHEGLTTTDGWQVYEVPLSDLKLNGGYGNQAGNRVIDLQAITGLEILVPGGQENVELQIDWVRIE